ncbi:4-(cytidine 5'-diphospho)-2-C-methyl-D-erythritol kinase [Flavonifractor sp. AGMB03687]|uniref:4-(cytidine 5'-diphospho)-2-C-methyl-D-erythritol kinase n=1 Tax=Flavonifractor sp. AGMB03687 TaxID=2785133 RepID=UPI001ADF8738|nr:4-(cytidine 5'-diphospho)-2-C-methyl-D-erythritol kinase [Flavonifractor sp. AGMB03687]
MAVLEVKAYAKLNLSLDVLGKRPDGYHDMRMVMQTVNLTDAIRLEIGTGQPLHMGSNLGFLPANESNLAAAAALRLCEATGVDAGGLSIDLEKTIPVCAGLAGGSADAAAVLRGLNKLLDLGLPGERLEEIGALVGSDVPYCVRGGTALAEGRGEILTDLPPLPDCLVVLCKPAFSVSTPELFRSLDGCRIRRRPDTAGLLAALESGDLPGVARRMYNVFEDALPARRAQEIDAIKNVMIQHGALGASMSGTGPTVFGLFIQREAAQGAWTALKEQYPETFLAESMGNLLEQV